MEAGTNTTTLTAKLLILNPKDYNLWLMRIEQYFLMTDYSLWEIIKNGNKVIKRTVRETKQEYEPTTAEEKQDRRNEMKARGTYGIGGYATLKEQYDSLSSDYRKSQFNLVSYKAGLESIETKLAHYKKNEAVFEESINVLKLEVKLRDTALVENKKKLEKVETRTSSTAVSLRRKLCESSERIVRKYQKIIIESENMDVTTVVTPSNVKTDELNLESASVKSNGDAVEPKTISKNSFRPPVIEDWNSIDESEVEIIPNVKNKAIRSKQSKIERFFRLSHIARKKLVQMFMDLIRERRKALEEQKHESNRSKDLITSLMGIYDDDT
ncbi:hypothetical protein Tco_1399853 [Tanacetum coccineum]